jgi:hypothetical protein
VLFQMIRGVNVLLPVPCISIAEIALIVTRGRCSEAGIQRAFLGLGSPLCWSSDWMMSPMSRGHLRSWTTSAAIYVHHLTVTPPHDECLGIGPPQQKGESAEDRGTRIGR